MESTALEQHALPTGNFGYSATGFEDLGATEYTIVTLVVDISGSVGSYKKEMETAIKSVVEACGDSPRKDNLMLRIVTFDTNADELHGFKLLADIDVSDYNDCFRIGGATALFDATDNAIAATNDWAKKLDNKDFSANALVAIITDGCDNSSNVATEATVKQTLADALAEEALESLITILIGVGVGGNQYVSDALDRFKTEAGLTQYIEIGNANPKTLAKLAEFVSKSISAQSQSLGTGGPSQVLQF